MKLFNHNILLAFAALAFCPAGVKAADKCPADSLVNLPYETTIGASAATGTLYTVSQSDLEKRVFGDLRGKLTGMIPGLEMTETGGSYFTSVEEGFASHLFGNGAYSMNLKGFSNATVIIDDVTTPFTQLLLDPNQIESITVVSSILDKVKAGPTASGGAIVIKTKRGGYNTPLRMHADFETGVNVAGVVPEWLNGAEYATYYNAARLASGYPSTYSADEISAFSQYDQNSLTTPCVDYKSLMYKNILPAARFGFDASAGSEKVKYNLSLNGMLSDDMVKAPERTAFNKVTFTGNVATKVGKWIEVSAGFTGLLGISNKSSVEWDSYHSVPEVAFPLVLKNDLSELGEETTFYGVSRTFGNNYYAQMMEGGFQTIKNRSASFNTAADIDFGFLLKGLKSRTFVQVGSFMNTHIVMDNDYNANYWTKESGMGDISTHVGKKATSRTLESSLLGDNLSFYERLSYDWSRNRHDINAGLVYNLNRACSPSTGRKDYDRHSAFIGNVSWSYDNRYAVEFAAQYAGTDKFAKGSRFGFFPSAGLAWTMSNEAFMEDASWLDNLRLHAQAGIAPNHVDIWSSPYAFQSVFSNAAGEVNGPSKIGAASSWFGNNTRTSSETTFNRYGNSDLSWCKIYQAEAGFNATVLGGLNFSADFYIWQYGLNGKNGEIIDVNNVLPALSGITATTYANYNQTCTKGFDLALSYSRRIGDFGFNVGGSLSHFDSKYTLLANDIYPDGSENLKMTGTSPYAIWGLECIGKYETQEQLKNIPSYSGMEVRRGDLMYKDINNDGEINTNDRTILGNTNPDFFYSLFIDMTWRDFDFQIVGTGRSGNDVFLTNEFFFNGWGEGNKSAFIKDEMYPNLSYVKSDNNFVGSSYWLSPSGWFKIQSVDLGYNLKLREAKAIKGVRFDLRGENLFTFTKLKYVDPEYIGSGVNRYPMFRVVTAGVKLTF